MIENTNFPDRRFSLDSEVFISTKRLHLGAASMHGRFL